LIFGLLRNLLRFWNRPVKPEAGVCLAEPGGFFFELPWLVAALALLLAVLVLLRTFASVASVVLVLAVLGLGLGLGLGPALAARPVLKWLLGTLLLLLLLALLFLLLRRPSVGYPVPVAGCAFVAEYPGGGLSYLASCSISRFNNPISFSSARSSIIVRPVPTPARELLLSVVLVGRARAGTGRTLGVGIRRLLGWLGAEPPARPDVDSGSLDSSTSSIIPII
jgi:hypothetical protein